MQFGYSNMSKLQETNLFLTSEHLCLLVVTSGVVYTSICSGGDTENIMIATCNEFFSESCEKILVCFTLFFCRILLLAT